MAFRAGDTPSPVVLTGENSLTPPTTVTGADVLSLMRKASEHEDEEARAAGLVFEMRMEAPDESFWSNAMGDATRDLEGSWAASGVVDGEGWYLDIANLDRPDLAPVRVGETPEGGAFNIPAPPVCPGEAAPGGLADFAASPFSDIYGEDGNDLLTGAAWRELLRAVVGTEDLGAEVLIDASKAETLPQLGDVYRVGVFAELPVRALADVFPTLGGLGADALAETGGGYMDFAVVYEIGGDGRLLSAEWDMTALANLVVSSTLSVEETIDAARDAARAEITDAAVAEIREDIREELGDTVSDAEIDEMADDLIDEAIDEIVAEALGAFPSVRRAVWRIAWRSHGDDTLEISEDAPGVWRRQR